MKRLLLVSYSFWPRGGIGTRRWSLFLKQLIRHGIEVHVLTTDYLYHDENIYLAKEDLKQVHVHRVPCNVSHAMLREHPSLFGRALRKFHTLRNKYHGMIDIADTWERIWIPGAYQIIDENQIENVIITGPPSSLHFHSVRIKARFPDVNLIQDYRDLWNLDRGYHYSPHHSRFMQAEALVMAVSDYVLTVNAHSRDLLMKTYGFPADKGVVLYNGYDQRGPSASTRNTDGPVRMVYSGRLPQGRQEGLIQLLECMNHVTKERFQLHLFTDSNLDPGIRNSVFTHLHEFISPDSLLDKISEFDIGLTINHRVDAMAFGSKIFDYMACSMPIFCISEKGELRNLLEKHDMPVCGYSQVEMAQAVKKLVERDFPLHPGSSLAGKFDVEKTIQTILGILK